MDDFSAKPDPQRLWCCQAMLMRFSRVSGHSSMSPTILLEGDEVMMVIGTPGLDHFTSVFQTVINIIDFGMTPLEAVGLPFHHQLLPPDCPTSIANPLPGLMIGTRIWLPGGAT